MASSYRKTDTSDFLKKFARVLKNPDIKTFQWSVDGRYVVVNWTLCEADRGEHRKALSIFKRVKDTTSLRRLLCFHGFKKIARRSSSDSLVFEHPGFVQRGEDNKSRSKCSGSGVHHLETIEDSSPSTSSDVLLDMCFSPIKRKNARDLYQYINYSCSESVAEPLEPAQDNPISNSLCTPPSLAEVQIPEYLDSGHSITANDPETDKSVDSLSEDRPLQECVGQTSLPPPLSPHPQAAEASADLMS